MARYELTGPDGSRYEVALPEGTPPERMREVIGEFFRSSGEHKSEPDTVQQPSSVPGELVPPFKGVDFDRPTQVLRAEAATLGGDVRKQYLDAWAKRYVENERKRGGIVQSANDLLRNIARGTPVGSWLDEANASTSGILNRLGLGGAPYEEALAYQRATDAAIDRESTKLAELPFIGDVTAAGAQKLVGGVLSAPVAPVARVMQGGAMLPNIVNAGVAGVGYGALYGAGEGETGQNRLYNALFGAGIGGPLGAATPPVAAGLSRAFQRAPAPQGALANMNRTSVQNVADDLVADRRSNLTPQQIATLHPETVIADLGPNLQGHAGGIARTPGEGQTIIKDTLGATVGQGRRGGAPARIQQDVDAVLGPPQDLVALERQTVQNANASARPFYEQFENTVIRPNAQLDRIYTRLQSAPGVVEQANRLMAIEGYRPPSRDWSARTGKDWDYFKRAVDDLARSAKPYSNEQRLYRQLARDATEALDQYLMGLRYPHGIAPAPNVAPQGISAYAEARRLSGEGQQFRQGLEQGQEAFRRGTHPDQMRADLAGMTQRPVQRQGFEAGARGAIRDIMGTASSTLGSTGDSAVMRQLGSDYAVDKLTQIVGQQRANQILDRLALEAAYEQTRNAAVGNSVTAAMQAQQRRYGGSTEAADAIPATLWSRGEAAARWLVNRMTAGYLDERRRSQALDAARILMAQGNQRDAMLTELISLVNRQGLSARQRAAAEDVLAATLQGSRQPIVESRALPEE